MKTNKYSMIAAFTSTCSVFNVFFFSMWSEVNALNSVPAQQCTSVDILRPEWQHSQNAERFMCARHAAFGKFYKNANGFVRVTCVCVHRTTPNAEIYAFCMETVALAHISQPDERPTRARYMNMQQQPQPWKLRHRYGVHTTSATIV